MVLFPHHLVQPTRNEPNHGFTRKRTGFGRWHKKAWSMFIGGMMRNNFEKQFFGGLVGQPATRYYCWPVPVYMLVSYQALLALTIISRYLPLRALYGSPSYETSKTILQPPYINRKKNVDHLSSKYHLLMRAGTKHHEEGTNHLRTMVCFHGSTIISLQLLNGATVGSHHQCGQGAPRQEIVSRRRKIPASEGKLVGECHRYSIGSTWLNPIRPIEYFRAIMPFNRILFIAIMGSTWFRNLHRMA